MKYFYSLVLALSMIGCATQNIQQSQFKEVDGVPSSALEKNKWHVCRNGAFSDNTTLKAYLDGEYVTVVHPGFPGFTRKITVIENADTGNFEIKKVLRNGEEVAARVKRAPNSDKNIYIVIDSATTGGYVIPLPFIVVSQFDGKMNIKAVKKEEFDKFCDSGKGRVFVN